MRRLTTRIVPCLAALAAVLPATAVAQTPSGGAEAPSAAPSPFQLSGGGNALLGKKVRFRGAVEPKLAGRPVLVQYLDPVTQAWTKQARTTVKDDGTFVARWKPRRIGQFRTRALVGGGAKAASASPELTLTVFRPAIATWYGPGFYGNTTACGIELTEETRRRRPPQPAVRHERRRALRVAPRSSSRSSTAARSAARRSGTSPPRPPRCSASRRRIASARSASIRPLSRRPSSRRSGS